MHSMCSVYFIAAYSVSTDVNYVMHQGICEFENTCLYSQKFFLVANSRKVQFRSMS